MGGTVALAYFISLMCHFPQFRPLCQAPTGHTTHGQDGKKLDFRCQSGRLLSLRMISSFLSRASEGRQKPLPLPCQRGGLEASVGFSYQSPWNLGAVNIPTPSGSQEGNRGMPLFNAVELLFSKQLLSARPSTKSLVGTISKNVHHDTARVYDYYPEQRRAIFPRSHAAACCSQDSKLCLWLQRLALNPYIVLLYMRSNSFISMY